MTGDQRAMYFSSPTCDAPSLLASQRLWVSFLLLCLGWMWAHPVHGAGLHGVGVGAQLDAVTATGMDVGVDVTTRCSVDVVVKSARCGEVDRISVVGSPDAAVSYSLNFPQMLQHAFACGPQFTVELLGLKSHQPTEHFRVEVVCDSHQVCSAALTTGVTATGAIPMSPSLAEAWDGLGPHTDLFAALREAGPELRREIDTYAFHLADWLKETGQELRETSCLCQWTGVVAQTPAQDTVVAYPGNSWVNGYADASLTMVPRCVRLGDGEDQVLKGHEGGIYAALPAIESCPVPQGVQAEVGWEGEIWTAAGGDQGWEAAASLRFEAEVDQHLYDSLLLSALRTATDPQNFVVNALGVAATLAPAPSREVDISLSATAWVDGGAGASTFLEARAWGEVLLWGVGHGGGGGGDPTPGQVRTSASIGGEVDDTIDDGECVEHE